MYAKKHILAHFFRLLLTYFYFKFKHSHFYRVNTILKNNFLHSFVKHEIMYIFYTFEQLGKFVQKNILSKKMKCVQDLKVLILSCNIYAFDFYRICFGTIV